MTTPKKGRSWEAKQWSQGQHWRIGKGLYGAGAKRGVKIRKVQDRPKPSTMGTRKREAVEISPQRGMFPRDLNLNPRRRKSPACEGETWQTFELNSVTASLITDFVPILCMCTVGNQKRNSTEDTPGKKGGKPTKITEGITKAIEV